MIRILEGNMEKVAYTDNSNVVLYVNSNAEYFKPHWHAAVEFIMPLRNEYTAITRNGKHCLRERDFLMIPPGEIHELHAPPSGQRLILLADASLTRSLVGYAGVMAVLEQVHLITPENEPGVHPHLERLMMDIYREYKGNDTLRNAAIYARIIDIHVALARNSLNGPALFPDVRFGKQKEYMEKFNVLSDYINRSYAENITLDKAADMAGFSKFHFSRLFKQITGSSFYDYLNRKRVSEAESLLLNPGLSITDVAMRSGFSSISTFNRVFKNCIGCTPSQFKSLHDAPKLPGAR